MVTTDIKIATQKQVITYTGKDMGYLDARELVREKGGLPSNVLHDDNLVRTDDWKALNKKRYYEALAREIYVYPKQNSRFQKGADVVDAFKDDKGREWIFPASQIPKEAFELEKPGLFVDPGNDAKSIEVSDKRVVIAGAVSITVINPAIQVSGQFGKVDETTRIPLYVEEELRGQLTDQDKRWLWRVDGAGVRPLVRGYDVGYDGRRDVNADDRQDDGFGVGWVSLSQAQAEPAVAEKILGQAPSWLVSLQRGADAAQQSLSKLEGVVSGDHLVTLRKLIRDVKALDIKE